MGGELSMKQNAHSLKRDWVNIDVQGQPMRAYLAKPETLGNYPAIIVLMEIFGINSHIQDVADRIAAEGYVAIAPNYYHRTTENLELGYTDRDVVTGRKHKEQTTRQGLIDDLKATLAYLKTLPFVAQTERVGCIGFCFGGHVAFIAAGLPEVKATVAFYPGGIATGSPGEKEPTIAHADAIHGEILCLFGKKDPLIPHKDVETIDAALRQAGRDYEIVQYENTGHGFFCNQRGDFDPSAAEDAWDRVKSLLARRLR